jgi:hypothetical protein
MADPVATSITKNTWVKVASNTKVGVISVKDWQPSDYYYDFRLTGEAAPTDDLTSIQLRTWQLIIQDTANIDVYMKCLNYTGNVIVSI